MARKAAHIEGIYERVPGSGRWYVRYEHHGKELRKSFGRDRSAAIEFLNKARLVMHTGDGVVPTSAKQSVRTDSELAAAYKDITLGDLIDGLLVQIKADPQNYVDQYNPPIRLARIKKVFGTRRAESIRPWEISDWLIAGKTPAGKPWSIGTRNRYKGVWSAIYTYGKEREKIGVNPCKDFKGTWEGEGIIRWLDDDEESRIRAVLQADVDACDLVRQPTLRKKALHHIYELDVALGTGVRRGEQYRVAWTDVNFERKQITLNRTKYGPGRVVHMIDDVVNSLRELQKIPVRRRRGKTLSIAPEELVFAKTDNKKWFKRVLKRAGVANFRWHDLRHTFISRLVQKNVNLKVVQEAAGHRTIAMTARYAHLNKTNVAEAMALLNRPKAQQTVTDEVAPLQKKNKRKIAA
jgi:integrase